MHIFPLQDTDKMTVIGIETITNWDIRVIRYFVILTGENIAD